MATLNSKDEEFVQVNSIETGIVVSVKLQVFWSIRLKRSLLTEHSSAAQNTYIFSMVLITRYDYSMSNLSK